MKLSRDFFIYLLTTRLGQLYDVCMYFLRYFPLFFIILHHLKKDAENYVCTYNGRNHLLLAMLQTFVWQHCQWHCLQKLFRLELPNSVRNAKKILEAMPLAILPTKSLQHC